jgi:serine/threonine protein kinase
MIAPQTLLQNRYLVLEQIGQGGMGAVYMATDQRFGSTVALKETFFDDPNLRKAFEREARLLNHLRHHALPRVSDHFLESDGQFLVMEFIPGADLLELLKERGNAFPQSQVLEWADQLLDALDYLHTNEPPVIHRDIKPQNLKLTSRNHIVLLDFGLAKGTAVQVSRVTNTGSVFGYSRNYAPLEQIQGTGTDPRSDLYSLGATLYHLLTNVMPPDALTRATEVLNGQPDPLRPANEVHMQVTQRVALVLYSAMALNAARRPQTAAEMREALREAARQPNLAGGVATTPLEAFTSPIFEQDTQLMNAGASGAPPTSREESSTGETASVLAHEAATVTDRKPATSKLAPSVKTSLDSKSKEPASVVTHVAPARGTATESWLSGRALAIFGSVALLVILASLVYTFTRQPAEQTPASAPTAIDASNQNTQTPPVSTDNQGNSQTSLPPAPPASTRSTNTETTRNAERNNTNPTSATNASAQSTGTASGQTSTNQSAPNPPETPNANEEAQREADRARREAQREAEAARREGEAAAREAEREADRARKAAEREKMKEMIFRRRAADDERRRRRAQTPRPPRRP